MLLLVNNLHEKKSIIESQDRQDFESMCALFVIYPRIITMHSCYDFALLHTC